MRIGVIGCGYIAASYATALPHHPELALTGVWDRCSKNLSAFVGRWPCRAYTSEKDLLQDESVDTVLNLTNPRNHYEVTHAALEAGKHVYSEKPLAMTGEEACALMNLAKDRNLLLASAPCSVLSETAQTLWHALRSGVVGRPLLVYANFDDGMIAPHHAPWNWRNEVGAPWPAKDEFEVGCTYEHAGYVLTWLAAFFGPACRVTSFATCLIPEKGIAVDRMAPDFTVGCIEYPDGVVARVTCSVVAPHDKSLTIIGDEGVVSVKNVRHERCPVRYRKYRMRRLEAGIERRFDALRLRAGTIPAEPGWTSWRTYPYIAPAPSWLEGAKAVDFLRGPGEMAAALTEGRPCRLSPELGRHIAELVEKLQFPSGRHELVVSGFPAMEPAVVN